MSRAVLHPTQLGSLPSDFNPTILTVFGLQTLSEAVRLLRLLDEHRSITHLNLPYASTSFDTWLYLLEKLNAEVVHLDIAHKLLWTLKNTRFLPPDTTPIVTWDTKWLTEELLVYKRMKEAGYTTLVVPNMEDLLKMNPPKDMEIHTNSYSPLVPKDVRVTQIETNWVGGFGLLHLERLRLAPCHTPNHVYRYNQIYQLILNSNVLVETQHYTFQGCGLTTKRQVRIQSVQTNNVATMDAKFLRFFPLPLKSRKIHVFDQTRRALSLTLDFINTMQITHLTLDFTLCLNIPVLEALRTFFATNTTLLAIRFASSKKVANRDHIPILLSPIWHTCTSLRRVRGVGVSGTPFGGRLYPGTWDYFTRLPELILLQYKPQFVLEWMDYYQLPPFRCARPGNVEKLKPFIEAGKLQNILWNPVDWPVNSHLLSNISQVYVLIGFEHGFLDNIHHFQRIELLSLPLSMLAKTGVLRQPNVQLHTLLIERFVNWGIPLQNLYESIRLQTSLTHLKMCAPEDVISQVLDCLPHSLLHLEIEVQNCPIWDPTPVLVFTQLERLMLPQNEINDITVLFPLTSLRELNCLSGGQHANLVEKNMLNLTKIGRANIASNMIRERSLEFYALGGQSLGYFHSLQATEAVRTQFQRLELPRSPPEPPVRVSWYNGARNPLPAISQLHYISFYGSLPWDATSFLIRCCKCLELKTLTLETEAFSFCTWRRFLIPFIFKAGLRSFNVPQHCQVYLQHTVWAQHAPFAPQPLHWTSSWTAHDFSQVASSITRDCPMEGQDRYWVSTWFIQLPQTFDKWEHLRRLTYWESCPPISLSAFSFPKMNMMAVEEIILVVQDTGKCNLHERMFHPLLQLPRIRALELRIPPQYVPGFAELCQEVWFSPLWVQLKTLKTPYYTFEATAETEKVRVVWENGETLLPKSQIALIPLYSPPPFWVLPGEDVRDRQALVELFGIQHLSYSPVKKQ